MITILTKSKPERPFNTLEIHPCMTVQKGTNGSKDIVEQCNPTEAEFWSLYVHYVDGGLECIADCDTEAEAEELTLFLNQFCEHNSFFS